MSGFCCFSRWGIVIGLVMTGLSFPAQGGFTFQSLPLSIPLQTIPQPSEETDSLIEPFDLTEWVTFPQEESFFSPIVHELEPVNDFQSIWMQTETGSLFPVIQAGALDTIPSWAYLQEEPVKSWRPAQETAVIPSQPGYFQIVSTAEPGTMIVSVSASIIPLAPALVSGELTLAFIGILHMIRRSR